jgi:hypothetical protein
VTRWQELCGEEAERSSAYALAATLLTMTPQKNPLGLLQSLRCTSQCVSMSERNDVVSGHGVTACVGVVLQWQQRPKAGMAPCKRASFGMVRWKASAYLFGGAADDEAKAGEVLVSTFFNDLYQYSIPHARWYPVTMKPQKLARKAGAAAAAQKSALLLHNFVAACLFYRF